MISIACKVLPGENNSLAEAQPPKDLSIYLLTSHRAAG